MVDSFLVYTDINPFLPSSTSLRESIASCICMPKYSSGVAHTSRALLSALPGSAQLRQMW